MDLGSVFIIFALVLLTILYITRPFYEKPHLKVLPLDSTIETRLLAEKEYLLAALDELEDNYVEQKINAEDYQDQRRQFLIEGIEVTQQIEAQAATQIRINPDNEISSIKDLHGDIMNDPLEAKIGERRRVRKDRGAGFCPKCGSPLQKSDLFCWKCGNKTSFENVE